MTNIWVWALGLAPFKDTFWTNRTQIPEIIDHNKQLEEWHPELESAVATLSMGTVGISDSSKLQPVILDKVLTVHFSWISKYEIS